MSTNSIDVTHIAAPPRTRQWYDAQKGLATANSFSRIMAQGQGKTRLNYLAELQAGTTYRSADTESWKRANEDRARIEFARSIGKDVPMLGLLKISDKPVCASPSGWIRGERSLVKILSPVNATANVTLRATMKLPRSRCIELQGLLWLSGWDRVYLVSHDPRQSCKPLRMVVICVERDEEVITRLAAEVMCFAEGLS